MQRAVLVSHLPVLRRCCCPGIAPDARTASRGARCSVWAGKVLRVFCDSPGRPGGSTCSGLRAFSPSPAGTTRWESAFPQAWLSWASKLSNSLLSPRLTCFCSSASLAEVTNHN